ncbi:STAS domain-containing protein [Sporosarcina sp. Te-1]|uniref:STAS domain-containing protein n=1 Tax=Sporosarcina sp. Te-1 TaxID=2818390 RepID=UPI001A9F8A8E|nr:STAS domain-containing protein [Sporosarcina sp. Te-1]QTD43143.1 STAS domain-containing protein [Sporosarcina sp. Te-1]
MTRCEELYEFLVSKATELTERWYQEADKSSGVYASTNAEEIRTLKEQNKEFHLKFFQVLKENHDIFLKNFEEWILAVAKDESHQVTPINSIMKEFYRVRNHYLELVQQFTNETNGTEEELNNWTQVIIDTMDHVTIWFLEEYDRYSLERLHSHRELINELSAPVISLTPNTGLLPLIGDIDTVRAKFILDETLDQCAEKGLDRLFIDLSGVLVVDTMVAQQLFQLHESLRLLGIQTTLCGIRPEIAQTATQLGLSFENISISSTLQRALQASVLQ